MRTIPGSSGRPAAQEASRPLSLRKRLLFGVMTVLILLVLAEAGGRVVSYVAYGFNPYYLLYGFYSWTNEEGVGHSEKYRGYFKFPANTTIKYGTPEPCRINNHGMRGPDFDARKAPGTFRVVCMGASSTFGYTNRDEGTYPHALQALFDADGLLPKVEVINAGIPHMRTRHIRAMFEEEIVGYEPDLVTFYEGYNDAVHTADENAVQSVCRWLDEHSAAYAGVRLGVNGAFGPVLAGWWDGYLPTVSKETVERQARLHAEDVTRNIGHLIETARSRGIQVLLVKQATTNWFEKRERRLVAEDAPRLTYEQQYAELEEKLRTKGALQGWETVFYIHHAIVQQMPLLADRHGLQVVDNIALLDERPEGFSSYVHLTEEANARLARELHKAIRAGLARKPSRAAPRLEAAR